METIAVIQAVCPVYNEVWNVDLITLTWWWTESE